MLEKIPIKTAPDPRNQILLNRNFGHLVGTIKNMLPDISSGTFNPEKAFFPPDETLSKFAKAVYKDDPGNVVDGWSLLTTASNESDGYFGAAFWNEDDQQLVIAHRGTNPLSLNALIADIEGIVQNQFTPQMSLASTFAAHVLKQLPAEKVSLSLTGHSLGAWLAQVTAFTLQYLTIKNKRFCLKSEGVVTHHPHAVGFESPGARPMLKKLAEHYHFRYETQAETLIERLDVTNYLTLPNRINCCNEHVGDLRMIVIERPEEDGLVFIKYNLHYHSVENVVRAMSSQSEVDEVSEVRRGCRLKVLEWPSSRWPERVVTHSSVPIAFLNDLKRVVASGFRLVFDWSSSSANCSEIEYYNKKIKNYHDPFEESIKDVTYGIALRFKVVKIDGLICKTNVFTEPEMTFLTRWLELKKQNLRFDVEDEILREHVKFLIDFSIDEDEKVIRCESKTEMERLKNNVKHMFRRLSRFKAQIVNKDMAELLKSGYQICLKESKLCVDRVWVKQLDFEDTIGLGTFLESERRVFVLKSKEQSSLEISRMYCILKRLNAPNEAKNTKIGTENSELGIENTKTGTETTTIGTENTKVGTENTKIGTESTKTGTESTKIGTENTKTGTKNTKIGTENTKVGSENTKIGTENTKVGSENTKIGTENTKVGTENTKTGTENTKIGTENTKVGTENTKVGTENTKVGTENTKVGTENTKVGSENTKIGTENTKVGSENTKIGTENTKVGTENTKVGTENTKTGTENTKIGTENTKVGTENTKIGTENTKVGTENTKIGTENTKVGTRKTKVARKKTKIGTEAIENGTENSKTEIKKTEIGTEWTKNFENCIFLSWEQIVRLDNLIYLDKIFDTKNKFLLVLDCQNSENELDEAITTKLSTNTNIKLILIINPESKISNSLINAECVESSFHFSNLSLKSQKFLNKKSIILNDEKSSLDRLIDIEAKDKLSLKTIEILSKENVNLGKLNLQSSNWNNFCVQLNEKVNLNNLIKPNEDNCLVLISSANKKLSTNEELMEIFAKENVEQIQKLEKNGTFKICSEKDENKISELFDVHCKNPKFLKVFWLELVSPDLILRQLYRRDLYTPSKLRKNTKLSNEFFEIFASNEIQDLFVLGDFIDQPLTPNKTTKRRNKALNKDNFLQYFDIDSKLSKPFLDQFNKSVFCFHRNQVEAQFKEKSKSNIDKSVHWLNLFDNSRVYWRKSRGPVQRLTRYVEESEEEAEVSDQLSDERFVVLSDEPGMGKSTHLTHIASGVKGVIHLHLPFHQREILSLSIDCLEDIVRLIIDTIDLEPKDLLEQVLIFSLKKGNLRFIFDAFDELNVEARERFLDVLTILRDKTKAKVWISTRPEQKEVLEDLFSTFSRKFLKFTREMQVDYLVKFWESCLHFHRFKRETLIDFANEVMEEAGKILGVEIPQFLGNPLHIRMMAEVAFPLVKRGVTSGRDSLGMDHFRIRNFFQEFVSIKYESYIRRQNLRTCDDFVSHSVRAMLNKHLCKLAIQMMFPEEAERYFEVEGAKGEEVVSGLVRVGLVQSVNRQHMFIYRVLAEYFAANFLLYWLKKFNNAHQKYESVTNLMIKNVLSQKKHKTIREFINYMLLIDFDKYKNILLLVTKD